jgi:hypothetical protein
VPHVQVSMYVSGQKLAAALFVDEWEIIEKDRERGLSGKERNMD